MISNRLAFAALGIACVAAAAGGGYMATRDNAASRSSTATETAATVTPADRPLPAPEPATETVAHDQASPAPSTPASRTIAPAPRTASSKPSPASSSAPKLAARAEQTALPEHAPSNASVPVAAAPIEPLPSARIDDHPFEVPKAPEPPVPTVDELTVSADSVIGVQMETTLSSERARIEDRVEARVVRDVRVGGRVAIPAGSRALGSVVVVERGGKMRDRARLGIRFHTLALADGTRLPITTETIYRYGDAPGNGSAAKIGGGAVAGAILGAIIGGGKGAAIGAATGAGGGSAAVMASDRSEAVFSAGAEVTARIVAPVTVAVER
jgi:hypothetical protein